MTPQQITLVQATFADVKPIATTAAELFYNRLFTLDPALRSANLRKMQEILFERGAFLIPAFGNELAAASASLGGLPDHDVTGGGIFRALRGIGFAAG